MGFMSPSTPGPDPALEKARLEEESRLEAEKKAEARRKAESERKRRANLVGQRSLQEEDIVGFQGFRTSKSMGKSIRS
jgi:hypothetical protein